MEALQAHGAWSRAGLRCRVLQWVTAHCVGQSVDPGWSGLTKQAAYMGWNRSAMYNIHTYGWDSCRAGSVGGAGHMQSA